MINLDAVNTVEECDGIQAGLSTLMMYLEQKKRAIEFRQKGEISLAVIHEETCDNIYNKLLPEELKW